MKYLYKLSIFTFVTLSIVQFAFAKNDFFDDNSTIESSVKKSEIFYDPIEPINRKAFTMFKFGTQWVLLPIAKMYDTTTPNFLQRHISSTFNNVENLSNSITGILIPQKILTMKYISSFLTNTIFGFGGFFDVSSQYQTNPPSFSIEDIAQYYSKKPLPYLVLPMGFGNIFSVASWGQRTLIFNNFSAIGLGSASTVYMLGGIIVGVNQGRIQIEDTFNNSLDPYSIIRNVYYQLQYIKLQRIKNIDDMPHKYSELISSEFI